jgi:uncharacterized protein YktA (UPF0223 family)
MDEGKWITLKDGRRIFLKPKKIETSATNDYMNAKLRGMAGIESKYMVLSDEEFDRYSQECREQLDENDIQNANDEYVHKLGCNAINNGVQKYGDDYINHRNELGDKITDTITSLDNLTTQYEIKKDLVTHRFVFNNYLENVYGKKITDVDFNKIDTNKYHSFEEVFADRLNDKYIGSEVEAQRFLSTSTSIDKNLTKQVTNVMMKINVPKGNTGYFTGNSSESELILPRKTKLKLKKAYIQKIDGWNKLVIEYDARTK